MTGSSPEPASLIPSGGLGSIAMASLYPETENIGLGAGKIDEGTIEGFRGDLILLTRTRGFALSVIDQSGNGGGTIGATGSVLIVRRETRPSCAVGTFMSLCRKRSPQWRQ